MRPVRATAVDERGPGRPDVPGPDAPDGVALRRRPLRADRPLPPLAAVLARPLVLLLAALIGTAAGTFTVPEPTFAASAVLQFTNTGSDSLRVKQVGQTVQRLAVSTEVVTAAAQVRRTTAPSLAARVSATWQQDSDLVTVTVRGPDALAAITDVNAVAAAAIRSNTASVETQLRELRRAANRLLTVEQLDAPEAEEARKAQLGAALAARQDAVNAQDNGLFIADAASSAAPQGTSRLVRALVGLLTGLLLGAFAAVLLGHRGLLVSGPSRLGRVVPELPVVRPEQAPELAGELVGTDVACLALVTLPGALLETAQDFACEVADHLRVHGRSVLVVDLDAMEDAAERRRTLRSGAREDVRGAFGTDVVVLLVDSGAPEFGMLVGQGGFRSCLVSGPRTRLRDLLGGVAKLARTGPVAVITP